jgi:hypothetical protein
MQMTIGLLEILNEPDRLPHQGPACQAHILRQARSAGVLGYLAARIDLSSTEGKLKDHLLSAQIVSQFYDTQIKWEVRCLERVLGVVDGPVVLLKGAAYKVLDLSLAKGRQASDVDLLLPREQLAEAEARLIDHGWEHLKEDEYEQHYYREWMHELPPLRHKERGTIVDLHHNILPPTARHKPDAAMLLDAAVPIPGSPLFTLSPEDTLLHRCAHLFVDGDMDNALRELLDVRGLFTAYRDDTAFWKKLYPRAVELDLVMPLHRAVYFSNKLLNLDIPGHWQESYEELGRHAGGLRTALTLPLMEQRLVPADPSSKGFNHAMSGWILFLRSHWLRMPPLLLTKHLLTQAWRRGGLKTGG